MKLRITVILLAVTLLTVGYTLAQSSIFTEFTGHDYFFGFDPTAGTIICPGGEPTGAFPPCTPGSRVHTRDGKFFYHFEASDPRLTGIMELTANGNFDGWIEELFGPGSGQMWGTMQVEVAVKGGTAEEPTWTPTGDVWEGTWTGTRTVTGTVVVITTHNVLFGTEGSVEGLKAEFSGTADPNVSGNFQGWILAPPGKSRK
jgi:hypothetical protein